MTTISLCMIVKDEEGVLERCLKSVKDIVDEIVLVDTGSIDNTKEIGEKYNCKLYDYKWQDDFSLARNYSFAKATMDYILWLDADDVIEESEREKINNLKKMVDGSVDAYSMRYNYAFDEDGNVSWVFKRYRLVKREKNFRWFGYVHEYLDVSGNLEDTDITINHRREKSSSNRNLKIYENKISEGETLSTRDIYYYAKELYDNGNYEMAEKYFNEYLDNKDGWIENKIVACNKLSSYYYDIEDYSKSKRYSLRAFEYDTPRPDSCCIIGDCFQIEGKYKEGIFWYELACNLGEKFKGVFIEPASYTWKPHLNLCICYYKLGDINKAHYHNMEAYKYNKKNENILHNIDYFKNIFGSEIL